ncbi:MAG: DNA gyrase inhibitor YacG [Rhodospirillales bacterium]|nr:DNA gyrase inhibitor YacG [Rhodospirillales bacterium]|tara:strand:+ start:326 stop:565 length:240 start_codon:yes stop_codon:yes gene_type:complete
MRNKVIIDLEDKKNSAKCPVCKNKSLAQYRPFCSSRCADIDLSKWLNGSYSVPILEMSEADLDELDSAVNEKEFFEKKD